MTAITAAASRRRVAERVFLYCENHSREAAEEGTRNLKMARARKSPRKPRQSRAKQLAALKAESERQLEDLIRRRLAMPIEQRMNFLRKRLPGGGSCL